MAYKIKNVTNLLEKRHPFLNSTVDIVYNKKNMIQETVKLKVGEELIFDSDNLPVSIHNLRIKKFIRVIKISENEKHGILNQKIESKSRVEAKPAPASKDNGESEEKQSRHKKKYSNKQEN